MSEIDLRLILAFGFNDLTFLSLRIARAQSVKFDRTGVLVSIFG